MHGSSRDPSPPPISIPAAQPSVVGLAGLEPAASSLSEVDGEALCYRAYSQVAPLRKCRRDGVNCAPPSLRLHYRPRRAVAVLATKDRYRRRNSMQGQAGRLSILVGSPCASAFRVRTSCRNSATSCIAVLRDNEMARHANRNTRFLNGASSSRGTGHIRTSIGAPPNSFDNSAP
jgi:hypothetical protein